jgi:hypothetical protein
MCDRWSVIWGVVDASRAVQSMGSPDAARGHWPLMLGMSGERRGDAWSRSASPRTGQSTPGASSELDGGRSSG